MIWACVLYDLMRMRSNELTLATVPIIKKHGGRICAAAHMDNVTLSDNTIAVILQR